MTTLQQPLELGLPPLRDAHDVGRSGHTILSYAYDFKRFSEWCKQKNRRALPADADAVATYVLDLSRTQAVSTIRRRLYGVADEHLRNRFPDPTRTAEVRRAFARVRRESDRQPTPKEQITTDGVRKIVRAIDARESRTAGDAMRALHDRAAILLTFAGALKKDEARTLTVESIRLIGGDGETVQGNSAVLLRYAAELSQEQMRALRIDDVQPVEFDAIALTVNASEFATEARTVYVLPGRHLETDPVRALARWLCVSGITAGRVFRAVTASGYVYEEGISRAQFDRRFDARLVAAGFDPERHSLIGLRTGCAFQIAANGGSLAQVLLQTGHRDPKNVRDIFNAGRRWANHPQQHLDL